MTHIDTNIASVVVYADRARVKRSGKIKLLSGRYQLEIPELPLKLDPDSVRTAAHGRAAARLLGVQVQRAFYTETPDDEIRHLEEEIEALKDQIGGLEARSELITQTRANLNDLASRTEIYAIALASGEISVDEQLSLFDRLRARSEELDQELLDNAARRRELERQLSKLTGELDKWRGTPRKEAYTAIIEIEVTDPGDLTVEFSYVVTHAGWQPLYDVRLREDGQAAQLEIEYLAQVIQRTGESWREVSLTLSTARPALAAVLPELDPWYLRPLPPRRPIPAAAPATAGAPAGADELRSEAPALERDAPVQAMQPLLAAVETAGAALIYRVPTPVNIPADGAPHSVTVAQIRLEPEMEYVAAPKLVEAAYRRAKVINDGPYTLLAGSTNLFAGDEFIGSTAIDLTPPQGEIELYFGVDDRIKVARELKRREVDKKLIGARRRIRYGYEMTLRNLLPGEARVSLYDQLPVSAHEEIKVTLESSSPEAVQRSELNELTWDLTLAAEEEKIVRFDFSVEYPQGMELFGLP